MVELSKGMLTNRLSKLLIVALALVVIGLGSVRAFQYFRASKFEKYTVKTGDLKIFVTAPGTVEAEKTANLKFSSVGRITYLPFKENDSVKKFQTLASQDISDLEAIKEKTLKDYEATRMDFDTTQNDTYKGVVLDDLIQRELSKSQLGLEKSVIDVEITDRAIKNSSLYAPFNGVITQVNGQINEWTSVFSTFPLIQIVDFDTLYFEAEVDQEDSALVQIGQNVEVAFDAKPGETFVGTVYEIPKSIKTAVGGDKTLPVKIRLSDEEFSRELTLGWDGDAQILVNTKNDVVLIPKSSVMRDQGDPYVYVLRSSLLAKRKIELGEFDGTSWEVKSGLEEGELIAFPR